MLHAIFLRSAAIDLHYAATTSAFEWFTHVVHRFLVSFVQAFTIGMLAFHRFCVAVVGFIIHVVSFMDLL